MSLRHSIATPETGAFRRQATAQPESCLPGPANGGMLSFAYRYSMIEAREEKL